MTGNDNNMEKTTNETEMQAFARELEQLATKWPDLQIEDRQNPEHMERFGHSRPCRIEAMRFQAWRPVLEQVEAPAIAKVREGLSAVVSFRRLVAWAASPKRLGEVLVEKGGSR